MILIYDIDKQKRGKGIQVCLIFKMVFAGKYQIKDLQQDSPPFLPFSKWGKGVCSGDKFKSNDADPSRERAVADPPKCRRASNAPDK